MQVGNDDFTLGITEITIRKGETKSIQSYAEYSFNLIKEDNKENKITYESVNENIAKVNNQGEILGIKEGTTWVKAREQDGTEHVVYVYVTNEGFTYAPNAGAGEDFAAILKADRNNVDIWSQQQWRIRNRKQQNKRHTRANKYNCNI